MAKWIEVKDIVNGISTLLISGKTLPNASAIERIKLNSPNGILDEATVKQIRTEQLRQVMELANQWYDILVPKEEYRSSMKDELTLEVWELAIKETLKLKDFKKVLDVSLVCEGIDKANEILRNVKAEKNRKLQEELNKQWRVKADITDEQRYRSSILSKWTIARMRKGATPFVFIDCWNEADITKRENIAKIMSYARKMFPNLSDDVLRKNLIMFVMQKSNEHYCKEQCNNMNMHRCYMGHHQLKLGYDGKKFFILTDVNICPKINKKEIVKE